MRAPLFRLLQASTFRGMAERQGQIIVAGSGDGHNTQQCKLCQLLEEEHEQAQRPGICVYNIRLWLYT